MRNLPKPNVTGAAVLQLCAASINDLDLKGHLLQAEADVKSAEELYCKQGKSAKLHTINGTQNVGSSVTGKEMERVYNGTFVKSSKTRSTYENLKKACVNDICPLCGQGTVHQLDHYLPITSFPVYGVTAINLIPACSDCNKYKRNHVPASAGEQTIHPYFDEVDKEQWLFGKVVESTPAAVKFVVNPPNHWDAVQVERLKTHFRIYNLGKLYSIHAAVEISNMRHTLKMMAATGGSTERIRKHLLERAQSCAAVYQNSWQRATFNALADSDWFCSGNFNLV